MKNKLISLMMSAVMFVTVFALPVTAIENTQISETGTQVLSDGDTPGTEPTDPQDPSEPQNPPVQNYDITQGQITLDKTSFEYTGSEVIPAVTVTLDGTELVQEQDYELTFTNNSTLR